MANPLRGEVELQTSDKTYIMRMSINAIVSIEDHFDKGVNQVSDMLADPASMRIGHLRSIIMHTLREHHPEVDETMAGEIIGQAGFEATAEAIQKAMVAAFPQAKAVADNPRKAKRAGTGNAS